MEIQDFLHRLYRITGAKSKAQLAEKIGVGAAKISDWERGRYKPTLPVLLKIRERYGVDFTELLGEPSTGLALSPTIPVFGYGSAGEGLEVNDHGYPVGQGEFEIVRSSDNRDPHSYATRVKGRSMYPYLFDGDVVEVVTNVEVRSGDIAIVIHDDGRKWIKRVKTSARKRTVICESVSAEEEPFELPADKLKLHKVVSIRRKGMY